MIITTNLLNNIETAITTPSNEIQGVFYVEAHENQNDNSILELSLTYNQIKTQLLNDKLGFIIFSSEEEIGCILIDEIKYDSNQQKYFVYIFESSSADGILSYSNGGR